MDGINESALRLQLLSPGILDIIRGMRKNDGILLVDFCPWREMQERRGKSTLVFFRGKEEGYLHLDEYPWDISGRKLQIPYRCIEWIFEDENYDYVLRLLTCK